MEQRQTSLEAHAAMTSSGKMASQRKRLVAAALKEPGTARELARRIGIPEHDATTRCARLKADNLLEEVGVRENPGTSRRAVVLGPTRNSLPWLNGEWEPQERKYRPKTLVDRVVEMAVAWRHNATPETYQALIDAIDELEQAT